MIPSRLRDAIAEQEPDVGPVTVGRFAAIVGVSRVTISAILNGRARPKLSLVERIAEATGRSVDWFLGLDECPECGRTMQEGAARHHCPREEV